MFLLVAFLGYLIAQISEVMNRTKQPNEKHPRDFSIEFFLKDNWIKMLLSLMLVVSISLLVNYTLPGFLVLFQLPEDFIMEEVNLIIYALIGFAPEKVLQLMKKRGDNILQPKEIKLKGHVYTRKPTKPVS